MANSCHALHDYYAYTRTDTRLLYYGQINSMTMTMTMPMTMLAQNTNFGSRPINPSCFR